MRKAPTITGLRNSVEAFRHFRPSGFLGGAHEALVDLLNHRLVGAFIAVAGLAGIAGTFITFWPR